MFDSDLRIVQNRYVGKSEKQLDKIFKRKRKEYLEMMSVLKPIGNFDDFFNESDVPLWVKIAHMDEFLECPHCKEEYDMKRKLPV